MATTQTDELIEELSRPVIKLVVALVALYFLRFVVGFLPGLGTLEIPLTFISLRDIATAIITAVMVVILVRFALEIEPKLDSLLSGPEDIVEDFVDIVKYLIFIVAIVLAYGGFAGIGTGLPFLGIFYTIVFFVLALIPTVLVAVKVFNNLDEITDLLTEQVQDAAIDDVTCPACDEEIRASLDFCPQCGEDVSDVEPDEKPDAVDATCPECEASVGPDLSFCGDCGAELDAAD